VVNFAHGSLYMLGAYIAFSLVQVMGGSFIGYLAALLIAALAVGLIGALIETGLLRRIYHAPELFQLLATFGVALVVQDLTRTICSPRVCPASTARSMCWATPSRPMTSF